MKLNEGLELPLSRGNHTHFEGDLGFHRIQKFKLEQDCPLLVSRGSVT
jgi:hypothetical protein